VAADRRGGGGGCACGDSRGGRYGATLPGAGTYRIVYDCLTGPAVTVS
jgi:hypothetical protein